MVLIGSAAPPHSALAAWQFASHGITQLPLFELQVGAARFGAAACMQGGALLLAYMHTVCASVLWTLA
jgi:hypothetical protein